MNEPTLIETVTLSEKFTSRPATLADAEIVAELFAIYFRDVGYHNWKEDPDDFLDDWQRPNFDLATSSCLVFTNEGQLIGQTVVWDTDNLPIHPWVSLVWHPDYNDTDIPHYLWVWAKNRTMQAVDRCPPDAKVSFKTGSDAGYRPRQDLLEAFGMQKVRHFFRMLIVMETPPLPAILPQGLTMTTYQHPASLRELVEAVIDGFRDHWGFVEQPIEEDMKEWTHHIENDKLFDQTLWFMPRNEETGEIAGVCFCRTEAWGQPEDAYVMELAVRPAYRKKGLGLAMLHHAFAELYHRGYKRVALHVDASSLTGATRLYEKAGMHIDRTNITYEYILRDGEELATTALDD